MHRFRTLLVLAFLIIALPLKGLAVAGSSFHHHPDSTAAHDSHDPRGHDRGHGHLAGAAVHTHLMTDGKPSDAHAQPWSLPDSAPGSACSTCGAHAVADRPILFAPGHVAAPNDVIPFHSPLHDGNFADGLYRPPRSILA
ncbi:MAG: hypothetical protein ABJB04_08830 [Betaproteobacteria bacterium]